MLLQLCATFVNSGFAACKLPLRKVNLLTPVFCHILLAEKNTVQLAFWHK
jgi:hypothetical protein